LLFSTCGLDVLQQRGTTWLFAYD